MFIIWMHLLLFPQNVWSYYGTLDTVGQVLNERRTATTSVIPVKALGIVWRESKNMADGAKTHLALFCLIRTLRYSDRRRHT